MKCAAERRLHERSSSPSDARRPGDGPSADRRRPPPTPRSPVAAAPPQGVIKQRSDYGFDETIVRVKADIATKGIRFFDEIDQTKLGAERQPADQPLDPAAVRQSAARRPVPPVEPARRARLAGAHARHPGRRRHASGVSWTDFRFVASRYQLTDRDPQIAMASEVAASIASAARKQP